MRGARAGALLLTAVAHRGACINVAMNFSGATAALSPPPLLEEHRGSTHNATFVSGGRNSTNSRNVVNLWNLHMSMPANMTSNNIMEMGKDNTLDMGKNAAMYFHTGYDEYLLFRSFHVNSARTYYFGLMVIILSAVFTVYVQSVRANLETLWEGDSSRVASVTAFQSVVAPCYRRSFPLAHNIWRSVLTLITFALDFALMLLVMSFNIGVFCAVVIGLSIGYFLFGHTFQAARDKSFDYH